MSAGNVVPARPRGFCSGVHRAIGIVERAPDLHGAPVPVRKEIVRNHCSAANRPTSPPTGRTWSPSPRPFPVRPGRASEVQELRGAAGGAGHTAPRPSPVF
ncbi:hypothetical protein [Kitasatospora sp. NPDC056184]|uniref:hypothetical protein n=1 Tax=Kitasatospora sp. NPDC056184 TaxID=3345738 RepID=UPI0035D8DB93